MLGKCVLTSSIGLLILRILKPNILNKKIPKSFAKLNEHSLFLSKPQTAASNPDKSTVDEDMSFLNGFDVKKPESSINPQNIKAAIEIYKRATALLYEYNQKINSENKKNRLLNLSIAPSVASTGGAIVLGFSTLGQDLLW